MLSSNDSNNVDDIFKPIGINKPWFSKTTKERLNALPNVSIVQQKGNWYLNGNFWQGEPVLVTTLF